MPTHFSDVDNPARWSEFVFEARYKTATSKSKLTTAAQKGKNYAGHTMLAGARVVPAKANGTVR